MCKQEPHKLGSCEPGEDDGVKGAKYLEGQSCLDRDPGHPCGSRVQDLQCSLNRHNGQDGSADDSGGQERHRQHPGTIGQAGAGSPPRAGARATGQGVPELPFACESQTSSPNALLRPEDPRNGSSGPPSACTVPPATPFLHSQTAQRDARCVEIGVLTPSAHRNKQAPAPTPQAHADQLPRATAKATAAEPTQGTAAGETTDGPQPRPSAETRQPPHGLHARSSSTPPNTGAESDLHSPTAPAACGGAHEDGYEAPQPTVASRVISSAYPTARDNPNVHKATAPYGANLHQHPRPANANSRTSMETTDQQHSECPKGIKTNNNSHERLDDAYADDKEHHQERLDGAYAEQRYEHLDGVTLTHAPTGTGAFPPKGPTGQTWEASSAPIAHTIEDDEQQPDYNGRKDYSYNDRDELKGNTSYRAPTGRSTSPPLVPTGGAEGWRARARDAARSLELNHDELFHDHYNGNKMKMDALWRTPELGEPPPCNTYGGEPGVGEPHHDDQGETHHQRGTPQDKPPPEVTSTAASPIFFDVGTPNTCKPPETSVRSHPAPLFVHPHLATETCTLIPEPTGLCCGGEGGITALGKHARDTQQGGLGGVPVTPGHMRTHEQHAHGAHTKGGHIGIANETPFSSSPEPASPYHFSRVVQKDMLEGLPDAHHEGGPRSTLPVAHREGGSGSTLHDGMFSDDPDGIDTALSTLTRDTTPDTVVTSTGDYEYLIPPSPSPTSSPSASATSSPSASAASSLSPSRDRSIVNEQPWTPEPPTGLGGRTASLQHEAWTAWSAERGQC